MNYEWFKTVKLIDFQNDGKHDYDCQLIISFVTSLYMVQGQQLSSLSQQKYKSTLGEKLHM